MRTYKAMQECNCCGKLFPVLYYEDGNYDYFDGDESPCDCEDGFSPFYNVPSINEWIKNLKKEDA